MRWSGYNLPSNSTVVIRDGHRRSYGNQAPLLGKYLRKNTLNWGTLGQLVMDEHQELLQQRAPLLPTGVPSGTQVQAGRLQPAVGFEQTDPGLPPSRQDLDQLFGHVPGVKDHHARGDFPADGFFDQVDRQRNLGAEVLRARPEVGGLEQHRGHLLMETTPRLFVGRERELRQVFGHHRCPLGSCFIAAIGAQAEGETHRATDRAAGDGVMRYGVGAVTMVVGAVHMVKEAAHVFAQGVIEDDQRLTAPMPMGSSPEAYTGCGGA